MSKGLTKALKLEFNDMKERKISLLFYLLVPAIIIWIYYISATMTINWGDYASLNLKLYDLFASDVFSIIIIFITTQLMVLRIVGERAPYGTLDRELIAISRIGMYFGKLFANLIFVLLQVIIIYIFGFIIFPARNYGSPIPILLFLFLIALFGLISGLTISIFSKNKEQAIQLIPFFVLILLLFSGLFVPLDQMPGNIRLIAENMPLTLGSQSLKMLTLDGVGFEDVQFKMWKLLSWIGVITLAGLVKFELERNR